MSGHGTITAYLVSDHARLHRRLEHAMAEPHLDLDAFADFRRGLLRHIAIEEKLLLPAVRQARQGTPLDGTHELRVEHAAITSLLVPTPDLPLCHEIHALLSAHDQKEERPGGIYEKCERWLSDDDLVRLGEQAAAYPEVRASAYFDGPNVHRTAESALASARRRRAPKKDRHQ